MWTKTKYQTLVRMIHKRFSLIYIYSSYPSSLKIHKINRIPVFFYVCVCQIADRMTNALMLTQLKWQTDDVPTQLETMSCNFSISLMMSLSLPLSLSLSLHSLVLFYWECTVKSFVRMETINYYEKLFHRKRKLCRKT